MPRVPKRSFGEVTQAQGPRPAFVRGGANANQFGALEAAAVSKAGSLRAKTGTALAAADKEFGAAVSDIGQKLAIIAEKERKEDENNSIKRGLVQLKERSTERTLGENGTFTKKGQNALNDIPLTLKDLDAARTEIADGMPNDSTREKFLISSSLHLNGVTQQIGKFRINQRIERDVTTEQATIESAVNAAAGGAGSPDIYQDQFVIAGTASSNIAHSRGFTPQVAEVELTNTNSAIMKAAAETALKNGRVDIANDIVEQKGDYKLPGHIKLNNEVVAGLRKAVASTKNLGEATDVSDLAFANNPGEPGKIFAEIRAKSPTDAVRKEALKLARLRVNEIAAVDRNSRRESRKAAIKHVTSGGNFNQWLLQNLDEAAFLDAQDLTAIENLQNRRVKAQRNPSFSNRKKLTEFNDLRINHPKEFLQLEDDELHTYLSKRDADAMIKKRNSLDIKLSDDKTKITANNRAEKAIEDLVRLPRTVPRSRKQEYSNRLRRRRSIVYEEVTDWIKKKIDVDKVVPSDEDIRARSRRELMNLQATANTGFLSFLNPLDAPSFADRYKLATKGMTKEQADVARVPFRFIPDVERDRLTAEIEKRGGIPSDDLLEAFAGAEIFEDERRMKRLIKESRE
jgi:hypothetical protein